AMHPGAAGDSRHVGPGAEGCHDRPEALVRRVERAFLVVALPGRVFPEERAAADLERTQRLTERPLERAVDGHHLAGGLHLRAERAVAEGELVEGPARYLHDDVVECRLERGGGLARAGVGGLAG